MNEIRWALRMIVAPLIIPCCFFLDTMFWVLAGWDLEWAFYRSYFRWGK